MNRTITYVALLQSALIVFGFLTLGIVLKFSGYPDFPGLRWNPRAVLLREHGMWLLLMPVLWTVFALKAREVDHGILSVRVAFVVGISLAAVVTLAFLDASVFPYTRPFWIGVGR